jgi:predicted RNase H-like nuclease (RuvC/YqgF family)
VKNRELEGEISRYKDTLAKMEKQWKQAVDAVNENKLQKQIEDLNAQLNVERKNVIQLKKDNTALRLKAHMTEDDPQLEAPGVGFGDQSGVAMERIKELEKALKLKDTEL